MSGLDPYILLWLCLSCTKFKKKIKKKKLLSMKKTNPVTHYSVMADEQFQADHTDILPKTIVFLRAAL